MVLGRWGRRLRWPRARTSKALSPPPGRKIIGQDFYAAMQAAGAYTVYNARRWPVERAVADAYERCVWAYKAIETIATNQARLPFRLRQGEQEVDDHPLCRVLNRRANPLETGPQLRKRLSAQLLLSKRGAFLEVTKSRGGDIVRLDLLPPGRTRPVPGDGDVLISHYEVIGPDGTRRFVEPDRVRWVRDPHPMDPWSGVTPLEAAGLSVEQDLMSRLYNVAFLANDSRPAGVLAVDGDMDEEEMERVAERFRAGAPEAGKLTVIAGDVSYVDLATRPRDMAYEAMSKNAKVEILAAFGVPESVLGHAADRTYDNADAEAYVFWTVTMAAHLHLLATGLDDDVDDDLEAFFDTSSIEVLQRAEIARRAEAREEFAAGLITLDEYRELAGYPPIGRAETRALWMPQGRQPVATSDKDAEELAAAAQPEKPGDGQPPPGLGSAEEVPVLLPAAGGGEGEGKALAAEPSERPAEQDDSQTGYSQTGGSVDSQPDLAAARALEAALAAALAAVAVRLVRRTAARLASPKARKGTRHWEPAGEHDTRVGTKQLDVEDAVDPARWQEEVEQAAHPILEAAAFAAAAGLAADWGAALPVLPAAVAAVVAAVVAALGASAARQAMRLVERLARREAAGARIGELRAAVDEYGTAMATWADTVAVHAATATINGARDAAAATLAADGSRKVVRIWRSRRDERVRGTHRAADGQVRELWVPFVVGGALLRYPGDPAGPPAQTYGCRCWLVHRSTVTGRWVPAPPGAITRNPFRSKRPRAVLRLVAKHLPDPGAHDGGERMVHRHRLSWALVARLGDGEEKVADVHRGGLVLTLKHLPGRHDQRTHGRGWRGGAGRRRDALGRFTRTGGRSAAQGAAEGAARATQGASRGSGQGGTGQAAARRPASALDLFPDKPYPKLTMDDVPNGGRGPVGVDERGTPIEVGAQVSANGGGLRGRVVGFQPESGGGLAARIAVDGSGETIAFPLDFLTPYEIRQRARDAKKSGRQDVTLDELLGRPAPQRASSAPSAPASPARSTPGGGGRTLRGDTAYESAPIPPQRLLDGMLEYQQYAHTQVNGALRRGTTPSETAERIIRGLDDAFEAVEPLRNTVVVHRGVSSPEQFLGRRGERVGQTFIDRGFVSTTTDPAVVDERFAYSGRLEITVPAGFKAIRSNFGEVQGLDEKELLLPRNTAFRVLSDDLEEDDRGNEIRVIRLEVVTQ